METLIKVLASPVRRAIIARLWDGEQTAGNIAGGFDLTHATISSHLKVLREAGVVSVRAEKKLRWYSVNKEALHQSQTALFARGFNEGWLPPGAALQTQAEGDAPAIIRGAYETRLSVRMEGPPRNTFRYILEPELMNKWCGSHCAADPVDGGGFSSSVALGLRIEGRYLRLVPGAIAVMRWAPALGRLPLPIGDNIFFLLFSGNEGETQLEVRQYTYNKIAARFLDNAWRQYLPRLCEAVDADWNTA